MPAARKPSERLEPNPVGRVEVVHSEFGAFSSLLVTLLCLFFCTFLEFACLVIHFVLRSVE